MTIKELRDIDDRIAKHGQLICDLQKQKNELLFQYARVNRKYPDGYGFTLNAHAVVIYRAMGVSNEGKTEIAYGVSRNGEPFDTLMERNINHPDYA